MKLVTLLHDVCKSEHYRWIEDKNAYEADFTSLPIGHGEKSVIMLLQTADTLAAMIIEKGK